MYNFNKYFKNLKLKESILRKKYELKFIFNFFLNKNILVKTF